MPNDGAARVRGRLNRDRAVLLDAAVGRVLDGTDAKGFLRWFERAAPELAPHLMAALRRSTGRHLQLAAPARALWNTLPQPAAGFRPTPLREPRRNDPCFCASGEKFKRCCGALRLPDGLFEPGAAFAAMLDRMDGTALDALDVHALPREPLLDTLDAWAGSGATERAMRLLDKAFATPATLAAQGRDAVPLLHALTDVLDERRERRDAVLERIAAEAPVALAFEAVYALAVSDATSGDPVGAWRRQRALLERFPDAVEPGLVEVALLGHDGAVAPAKERLRRLRRELPARRGTLHDLLDGLADELEDTARPHALAHAMDLDPAIAALVGSLVGAPLQHARYRWRGAGAASARRRRHHGGSARLEPDTVLVATTARWLAVTDQDAGRDGSPFPSLDGLAELCAEAPAILSSFAVLADAVDLLDAHADFDPLAEAPFPALLARAERLAFAILSSPAEARSRAEAATSEAVAPEPAASPAAASVSPAAATAPAATAAATKPRRKRHDGRAMRDPTLQLAREALVAPDWASVPNDTLAPLDLDDEHDAALARLLANVFAQERERVAASVPRLRALGRIGAALDPTHADYVLSTATIELARDDPAAAIAVLEAGNDALAGVAEVRLMKAIAYLRLGDLAAFTTTMRGPEDDPDAVALERCTDALLAPSLRTPQTIVPDRPEGDATRHPTRKHRRGNIEDAALAERAWQHRCRTRRLWLQGDALERLAAWRASRDRAADTVVTDARDT